jgi:hypothetical protein
MLKRGKPKKVKKEKEKRKLKIKKLNKQPSLIKSRYVETPYSILTYFIRY